MPERPSARSAEKAMTALARWRAVYVDKVHLTKRRPPLASQCDNLKDAMHFRRQIISEVSRKVAQIQNPSLGEFKLRDLNDEINKLIREKGYWEDRIKELNGPDYRKHGPKMLDREGKEAPGSRGYRYFGAARDLPGVRELFEADPAPPPKKSRSELMRHVDVDYYGYRDEDDGVVLAEEKRLEVEVMEEKVAVWKARREIRARNEELPEHLRETDEENIYDVHDNPADEEIERWYDMDVSEPAADEMSEENARSGTRFVSHVPVPTQEMIEAAIIERKKRELLAKYASDDLMEEAVETERLLGIQKQETRGVKRKRGDNGEEEDEDDDDEGAENAPSDNINGSSAKSRKVDGTKDSAVPALGVGDFPHQDDIEVARGDNSENGRSSEEERQRDVVERMEDDSEMVQEKQVSGTERAESSEVDQEKQVSGTEPAESSEVDQEKQVSGTEPAESSEVDQEKQVSGTEPAESSEVDQEKQASGTEPAESSEVDQEKQASGTEPAESSEVDQEKQISGTEQAESSEVDQEKQASGTEPAESSEVDQEKQVSGTERAESSEVDQEKPVSGTEPAESSEVDQEKQASGTEPAESSEVDQEKQVSGTEPAESSEVDQEKQVSGTERAESSAMDQEKQVSGTEPAESSEVDQEKQVSGTEPAESSEVDQEKQVSGTEPAESSEVDQEKHVSGTERAESSEVDQEKQVSGTEQAESSEVDQEKHVSGTEQEKTSEVLQEEGNEVRKRDLEMPVFQTTTDGAGDSEVTDIPSSTTDGEETLNKNPDIL